MPNKLFIAFVLLLSFSFSAVAQKEKNKVTDSIKTQDLIIEGKLDTRKAIDPLSPARAAFYSAVLPGLGHAYTKKYWKIPVIYAGLGAGVYFYVDNNKQYNRYRDAYKSRLAGFTDDEFYGTVSTDGLEEAQKTFKRNKELSLLVTVGIYALNIIWANVDAHLMQFNVDDNLSFQPHYKINEFDRKGDLGFTLNFKF